MIYSSACEYAILALVVMAQKPDERHLLKELAEKANVPAPFLSKAFQDLVKAGLLRSTKGPKGGYTFRKPPPQITLYDIKKAIDGVYELEGCAVGWEECSDEDPCPLHDSWKPIRQSIEEYLKKTTLQQMVRASEKKRLRKQG